MSSSYQLNHTSVILRNDKEFLSTQIDGEAVIMNIETGDYFGLNSTVTDMWNLTAQALSISALKDQMLEMYDVKEEDWEKDSMPILEEMYDKKMIIVSN